MQNAGRMQRFMRSLQEGADYGFLSLYFFNMEEAERMADEIIKNSSLKYLSLPHCYAGPTKIAPIVQALTINPMQKLENLDLNDNRLTDEGLKIVTDFLKESKSLITLKIRANRLTGGEGCDLLADALTENKVLTSLDLGNNHFGNEGIAKLDKAFAVNKSVTDLDLSENRFTAEGVRSMKNLFMTNTTVKKVRLQYNNIGQEGAEILAAYLHSNKTLEKAFIIEQYIRVLVARGLLQNAESRAEANLDVVLWTQDVSNTKIISALNEWEDAKLLGRELIHIPREVFEYQDAGAIKAFMKAALADGLSANKAVKMLMVGRARAGKTSLTNSLVNDVSGLTKDDDNRATVSVEIRPWVVDDVNISVWDFAGQEEYYMTHTFFLSRRCVVVLIFDLSRYKDFLEDIYYWVKALQTHVPGVSFFLVGTHIDNMKQSEIDLLCTEVVVSFHEEERRVIAALDKRIEIAEEQGETDMTRVREQRDRRPKLLFDKVFPVSSAGDMPGVAGLREELVRYATNSEVAIKLPNSYVELLKHLQAIAVAKPLEPIVERANVRSILDLKLQKKFKTQDDLDAAIELLHLVGQVLWYRENDALADRVFVSPRWVVDVTKALVRHDMFKSEHGSPGVLYKIKKPASIRDSEWTKMNESFYNKAVLDVRFLELFDTWRELDPQNRKKLFELLKQFELIIELPRKKKTDAVTCLIPLYLKSSFHPERTQEKSKLRKSIAGLIGGRTSVKMDKHRVTWKYNLLEYFPEGLFFRILVRCYLLGKVVVLSEKQLYARIGKDIKVLILEDKKNSNITLVCSHQTDVQKVWPALVLFATEIESLFRTSYQGVRVDIQAIAADNRLRERELCNHVQHYDMVPPIAYMHVVLGNMSAADVGLILRLDNAEQQLASLEANTDKSKQQFEVDLLAKDVHVVLERVLKNICVQKQVQVRNGRDFSAYLKTIEREALLEPQMIRKLALIQRAYTDTLSEQLLFESAFIKRMLTVGREILPELPDEAKVSTIAGAGANFEPSNDARVARALAVEDAAKAALEAKKRLNIP